VPVSGLAKRFGIVVRNRRIAASLSQERLAELARVHPTYVGMVERGVRNPTIDVAERIAKALKSDLSTLVGEAEHGRKGRQK
jgi:transcriptional regulator with XRE-family HTH domain